MTSPSGLTLSVPVKITNFHNSWNGEALTPADASMYVVCRVFVDAITMPAITATGKTPLPPLPEGGSLDTVVTVNVDANIAAIGGPDGKTVECALRRSDSESAFDPNVALVSTPGSACGAWTDDSSTCAHLIRGWSK